MKYIAEIEVLTHQEHIPVRGEALASGDDTEDKRVEDAILARLADGDDWAWCTVEVRAEFRGITGSDYLGCCCYKDEADFRQPGGYFDDMVCRAVAELASKIADLQGVEITGAAR